MDTALIAAEAISLQHELHILSAELSAISQAKFKASRETRSFSHATSLVGEHRAYEYCAQRISKLLEDKKST